MAGGRAPGRERQGRHRGPWIIGIDTGGTFTDLVCLGPSGLEVLKVPSTRDDPSRAVVEGIRRLEASDPGLSGRRRRKEVVHGSTVATNTILERKGARTAFLTTAGFRDLLEIGRQNRRELYNLDVERPEPLVPRRLRLEISERLLPDGKIDIALDVGALDEVLSQLRDGVEAVAIGFLFSCRNPAHERAAARRVRRLLPGRPVTLSSRVSPEIREYERFSTATLNAYVAPRMIDYLARLGRGVPEASIEIMGSGGGTVPLTRAREEPVTTILSGPAAGVLGAAEIAREAGLERIITLDMGGTSTDVSLVSGEVQFRGESEIGGLPFRIPVLDVHTVGAGGGSIARIDSGGSLRVGPESAGADPGPAVYGTGRDLTVTDVHVHLGHLGADSFLGGAMEIHPGRATPLVESLAGELNLSPLELARGVLRVVDAEMERAIRVVSQERGHDPRDFALMAFGGASGLHAAALARQLLIPTVLIPPHPGMLCARGMVTAERIRWRSRTVQLPARLCPPGEIERIAAALSREALRDFPGIAATRLRRHLELDLRFQGQSHVLTLPFRGREIGEKSSSPLGVYEEAFRRHYDERFGTADASWVVEVVTVRISLGHRRVTLPAGAWTTGAVGAARGSRRRSTPPARRAFRQMVVDGSGRPRRVPILARADLAPGHRLDGPAVVAEYSGTTLVPADWRLEVDPHENLILRRGPSTLTGTPRSRRRAAVRRGRGS